MADWNGFLNKSSGFGGGSMRNEDFDEGDVWGVAMERERNFLSPKLRVSKESSGSSSAWLLPTSPRKIPRTNSTTPNSLESDSSNVVQRSSAPMDIPDWSKIYGKRGVEEGVSNKKLDCGYGDHYGDDDDDDDDGGGGGNKYPDLTHTMFESDDLEIGGSVIDLVKSSKEEAGQEFKMEDEIDHMADLFIRKFRRQIMLQKQDSLKRNEMQIQ